MRAKQIKLSMKKVIAYLIACIVAINIIYWTKSRIFLNQPIFLVMSVEKETDLRVE